MGAGQWRWRTSWRGSRGRPCARKRLLNAATLSRHNRIGHTLTSASANDVCRKDRRDGLTVNRRLESPAKKMALVADVFIVAPDVRMSILAVGSPMRPYTSSNRGS